MDKPTIPTELTEFKEEFKGLKSDVSVLKTDVSDLKNEFTDFKASTTNSTNRIQTELTEFKQEFRDFKGEMEEFREYMANNVLTKGEFFSYMDAFMGKVTKVEQEQTMQTYRMRENTDLLERHDREIKELQLAVAT